MPYIQLKTNKRIDKVDEIYLKGEFGTSIGLLSGKSENWLMVEFTDDLHLYFQGSDAPCAILEVKVYGRSNPSDYDRLTNRLTELVSDRLKIDSDRIYVEYEETPYWGYSGSNF